MSKKKVEVSDEKSLAGVAAIVIPKGRPKSGRIWKSERKKFSSMKKDKPFNTSFAVKMNLKRAMDAARDQDRALKAARKQKLEEKRKRSEENKKRREENARKAEVIQTIRNPAKLKRLKKKQLRNVEKR